MSKAACAKLLLCSNKTEGELESIKDRLRTAGDITDADAQPVIAIIEDCMAKLAAAREMIPLS